MKKKKNIWIWSYFELVQVRTYLNLTVLQYNYHFNLEKKKQQFKMLNSISFRNFYKTYFISTSAVKTMLGNFQ